MELKNQKKEIENKNKLLGRLYQKKVIAGKLPNLHHSKQLVFKNTPSAVKKNDNTFIQSQNKIKKERVLSFKQSDLPKIRHNPNLEKEFISTKQHLNLENEGLYFHEGLFLPKSRNTIRRRIPSTAQNHKNINQQLNIKQAEEIKEIQFHNINNMMSKLVKGSVQLLIIRLQKKNDFVIQETSKQFRYVIKKEEKKKKMSDVDTFLNMVRKKKLSGEQFIYLVREQNFQNDHYNMRIVNYSQISEKKYHNYYTCSAKGMTKYYKNIPTEFVLISQWLQQRKSFNTIKELKFFLDFRKWKTLKKWYKLIINFKFTQVKNILQEKLFLVHPIYQKIIRRHREICYDIEGLKFIEIGKDHDSSNLCQFLMTQNRVRQQFSERLQKKSKQLHDNTQEGIQALLLKLKDKISKQDQNIEDDISKKSKHKDVKKDAIASLGFPDTMNYGSRSFMRSQFVRFVKLSFYLEFMTTQSLGKIFINCANNMLMKLQQLNLTEYNQRIGRLGQKFKKNQNLEGLFSISFKFNQKAECEYTIQELSQDVLLKINKQEIDFKFDLHGYPNSYRKFNVSNLINFEPTEQQFVEALMGIFRNSTIEQGIKSWKGTMDIYISALQEWDDVIRGRSNDEGELFVDPSYWIKEQHMYKIVFKMIKQQIGIGFNRIMQYRKQYQQYMEQFYLFLNTDYSILKSKGSAELFQKAMNNVIELQKEINEKFSEKEDIGLFTVESKIFRAKITQKIKNLIKNLAELMMNIFQESSKNCISWMEEQIKRIVGPAMEIQEYAEQKEILSQIYNQINVNRDQAEINRTIIYLLYNNFPKMIQPIHNNAIQKLNSLETALNSTINQAQIFAEKNIENYKKSFINKIKKFHQKAQSLLDSTCNFKYIELSTDFQAAVSELTELNNSTEKLQTLSIKYQGFEELLQMSQQTDFQILYNLKEELSIRYQLWKGIKEFQKNKEQWEEMQFEKIDRKAISKECDKYVRIVNKSERNLPENNVVPFFKKLVWQYKDGMPVVAALKSQYMMEEHFQQVKQILNKEFDMNDPDFTLRSFFDLGIVEKKQLLLEVSAKASQQYQLKTNLSQVEELLSQNQITVKPYKDVYVMAALDQTMLVLDQSLANVNNVLANRYVQRVRLKAQKLSQDIQLLMDIIENWAQAQKKWMYLENIFIASDIRKQMAQESKDFEHCDKFVKNVMKKVSAAPKILKLLKIPNLFDNLLKIADMLEQIEKQLQDYLEVKRTMFPRFFFLSNDELLQILAKSANLQATQQHLGKCFEGLVRLYMGPQKTTATSIIIQGMISAQKQVISFYRIFPAKGQVELWLLQLQKEMYEAIKKLIKIGLADYFNGMQKTKVEWIYCHKSQVVATVSQILWTMTTQQTIRQMNQRPQSLFSLLQIQISTLQSLTTEIRTNLTPMVRKIIVALITTQVHNRDIITTLATQQISSLNDFFWQQQLRYYFQTDQCVVRQVTSYLGATTRLVITPLTDRCWITITSALSNNLGANPAGPAGTGKTESVKDLAKGIARLCIVFNCSDQINAVMMNKLFKGLTQQGAWSCLDQFNRIDIQVLSVIAQQLLQIRMALNSKSDQVDFDGNKIPIRIGYGCFITMNPGYAGRTQLPDNLKSLFRPVSMMIPDYAMIAQIMLFAEGFEDASNLSKKMVQLYKLSSQQLSQQDHYDFGMRAVKSLLVMAGSLKRSQMNLSEDTVLIRAMKDANVPKFLKQDIPLFKGLINDLFPKVIFPPPIKTILQEELYTVIDNQKYENDPAFVQKVNQLYQTFNVRFGVMLVGESGVGKSVAFKMLAFTLNSLKKKKIPNFYHVEYRIINPKSITMGELYGEVDPFTQQWNDGLASSIIRQVNTPNIQDQTWDPTNRYWVVFDGPVDALWIENMNTVLDDNQTLCLANSQRIKLRSELRMLFEVQDLAVASPATVSRCGMVYMSFDNLHWTNYVKRWMKTELNSEGKPSLNGQQKDYLMSLFTKTIDRFWQKKMHMNSLFPITAIQSVQNICRILFRILLDLKRTSNESQIKKKIQHFYIYSLIWGAMGSIKENHYLELQKFLRQTFNDVIIPRGDTIFDFFIHQENQKSFINWIVKVPTFQFNKGAHFFSLLVPTVDTIKFTNIITQMLDIQKPLILSGESGVGKSVLISNLLAEIKEEKKINSIFLNFSAQTNSKHTQLAIQAKLVKKGKTLYGARPKEKIAIFIDDINMPALEFYGAQPCIQLLRFFIDQQSFYDRNKLFLKHIQDTTLLAACAPPGGGRNKITPRFLRHMLCLCLPLSPAPVLFKIFSSILSMHLIHNNMSLLVPISQHLIHSTIKLYMKVSQELLPTPSKFHYLFNLRDMAKVVQGMMSAKMREEQKFIKLWVHECMRIFADRFIDKTDVDWFKKVMNEIRSIDESYWESRWTDVLKIDLGSSIYQQVTDSKKLIKFFQNKQEDYNSIGNDKMDLVFFDDAIEQILRICRILRQPRGNAMLIGLGGSGKQSLAKLSSFIMKSQPFQIQLIKNYGSQTFRGDLQKLSKRTGVEMKSMSFIFTDVQIVFESFLEDINNLLNTGQVPNLFAKKQEIDDIINTVRPIAIKNGIMDSPQLLWSYFIDCIRSNLHVVLCMSPVGEQLRVRCRKFPSMVNCCTLDWFPSWSNEALLEVANKFMREINFPKQELKTNLSEICRQVSIDVKNECQRFYKELRRQVYTTPKSYLDHIKLYAVLLSKKREQMQFIKKKLTSGIEKLYSTNQIVGILKIQMQALQPQLAKQSEKTQNILKQLAIDSEEASKVQILVEEQAAQVNLEADDIKIIADQAEAQLGKALPTLRQAEQALNSLNKADITEIKGFTSPPSAVVMVLEAVLVLLGQKSDWNNAKQVMIDINFLDRLRNYEKNSITQGMIKRLRNITSKEQFNPQFVGQKSYACRSLCMWCRAMQNYYKIWKEVEPKKKKVAEMKVRLDVKNKELKLKVDQLKKVKNKVAILQKECDQTMEYKKKLENDMQKTAKRLVAAQKLTVLLADQGIRWKQQISTIGEQITNLIGDVFLSTATISYLGPFTGQYRQPLINQWMLKFQELNIPFSANYSLAKTLQTPIRIRQWTLQGLPSDNVSIENAIITTKCERWPLLIDPQGEANKWIKKHQPKDVLKVINFSDTHFLKTIQTAITSGYPVLLQNIQERLEPSIDSVLQKQIYNIQGMNVIRVGDKKLDYNQNFFFYLTTKMSNPHYLPEIYIKVTVINFSITVDGLKEQLLVEVMKHELPEIQKQRDQIIVKIAQAKKQIKQSQDKILSLLSQSKGMILDDQELISTLEISKINSQEIKKSLQETSLIQQKLNKSRNVYIPVSIRGTIIYFVIKDLCLVDPMYQYSLTYFKKKFNKAMSETEASKKAQIRLQKLIEKITCNLYEDICRGLFESHKKIFSYLICTSINRYKGKIGGIEWNLMLRGATLKKGQKLKVQNPDPNLFDKNSWELISQISENVIQLLDLNNQIKLKLGQWKKYIGQQNLIVKPAPEPYQKIRPFNKLLLTRALVPSKIINQMSHYVSVQMGPFFDETKSTSMEEIFLASDNKTPVIFILSQGADPTELLLKFAVDKNKIISMISLGQGQGKKAENLVERSKKLGGWVLLQNCHLAKSWLGELDRIVIKFQEQEVHQNFRLFLTSMPAQFFPVSVLQNGIKLTTQPPRGLKANLKRSYQQLSQQFLQSCENKPQQFHKLLFGLTFFHAIIQERRKFGPIGFNIRYEFNDSDLDISISTLRMFLNENAEELPWDAMIYITGHIIYGGRITDDWDRICLLNILKLYYNNELIQKARYKLSSSGIYYCENYNTISQYKNYFDKLPNFQDPQIFGMHQNANITFQTQESNKILETVLSIQPRVLTISGGKSPDQIVVQLAKTFLDGLPQQLNQSECNQQHFYINSEGNMASLSNFLLQEIEKFNILLKIMKESLINIQKAIQGLIVLSQDLDQMHLAFINNQLPPIWKKVSYASLKPLNSWYKDMQQRVSFLKKWLTGKRPNCYWMSGFYFPQGFLTSVLQTHSRNYKIPIDTLSFKFKTIQAQKEKIISQPTDGVYIYGLYLEGARWENKEESIADQVIGKLYFSMPVIHFLPVQNYVVPLNNYKCPCYKTSVRAGQLSTTGHSTNFILAVYLPSQIEKPQFWTLRGTALLCQLDY